MKFLFGLFFCLVIHASYAQEKYLLISSGGGVVGTATVYKIHPDGKVLKGKGLGEIKYTEAGKLKKCATKKYFKRAKAAVKSNPEFNHPGNMYSSIAVVEEGKENKITWGDADHAASEDIKKLYEKINTRLSRLTFTPDTRK
jgi:hypothetical protein